jgi:hypothetical protein
MTTLHCTQCGAAVEASPDDAIVTCSYCGTSFLPDGQAFKNHFALKVNYTETEAFETLKAYLVKVPGVPNDLAAQISLKGMTMTYYPYWVFNVQGAVAYQGRDQKARFHSPRGNKYTGISWDWIGEAGRQEQTRQIRLYAGPPTREEIRDYPIATRTRRYFNLQEAKEHTANILFSKVSEQAAADQAVAATRAMIYNRINRETAKIENASEDFQVTDRAYVHAPIYSVQFTVGGGGKVYDAAIDASNGRVLFTKIPRTTGFKVKTAAAAVIWFALAAVGALIALKYILPGYFYAGVGLAVIAAALAILTLFFGFRRVTAEVER